MGFGQNENAWTESQAAQVREAMKSGLRRFYLPPVLPGEKYAHEWNFLSPHKSITTESGTYAYDLPSDYAVLADTPMTLSPSDTQLYPDVTVTGEQEVRRHLALGVQHSGVPRLAAVVPKVGDIQSTGMTYQIWLWPVPDGEYTLNFRYRASPTSDTFIHGGQEHYQTALEACLAAADVLLKRRTNKHEQLFLERLIASVSHDRRVGSAQTMNSTQNGCNSWEDRHWRGSSIVTYNGQAYE